MDDEDKAEMRADQKLETRQGFGLEDKKPHDGAEGCVCLFCVVRVSV